MNNFDQNLLFTVDTFVNEVPTFWISESHQTGLTKFRKVKFSKIKNLCKRDYIMVTFKNSN